MKHRHYLLCLLLSAAPIWLFAQPNILFQYVDPLQKVLKEAAFFPEKPALAEVARGEHASFQFVVRSDAPLQGVSAKVLFEGPAQGVFADVQVGFVGYVRVGRNTPTPSRDRLMPPSGFFPDPIMEIPQMDVPAHTTQPVWVTVAIPASTKPGEYKGKILLQAKSGKKTIALERPLTVKVYPVTIGKPSLWFTNWFTLDPGRLALMNNGQPVQPYSDRYWQCVGELAKIMAEYYQNVALISPLHLTQYAMQNGKYQFDFSRFDRMVDASIQAGVIGKIEGGHIAGRESHWTSPFYMQYPVVKPDTVVFESKPANDPDARAFYEQFIPALVTHLKAKGWYGNYMQHIADEPIKENVDSYVAIARFVKSLAPDIRIIEACHSKDVENTIDVWVPQLDFFHIDNAFYQERAKAGDEVWYYTCLAPQGEYANRFVELPAMKTRVLYWINFRYNSPGYLHWGLNFWNQNPFDETTGIITESGNVLPGGDAWVVYPAYGKLWSSQRLEAIRDGVVDYELLKQLDQKYPDKAREMARQVVYQFNLYDINIEGFRNKRRQILELLSQ